VTSQRSSLSLEKKVENGVSTVVWQPHYPIRNTEDADWIARMLYVFCVSQDFQDMALSTLWRYTADTSCLVVSAAFTALSKFPFDSMKYSHMSEQVSVGLIHTDADFHRSAVFFVFL